MEKLKNNELFLTTTDTIIGIGGKVNDQVKKEIYKIKKRDENKKLVIVIGSIEQLKELESLNSNHLKYIKKYWPGKTTLIINDQAYRIPGDESLREFILKEGPFYLTSANISNEPSILKMEEAIQKFPNLKVYNFGKGSNKHSKIINTKNGERLR